jgi:hypothetical protein
MIRLKAAATCGAPLRSLGVGQEAVVVNLDLKNVERDPSPVEWVDDLHPPRSHN